MRTELQQLMLDQAIDKLRLTPHYDSDEDAPLSLEAAGLEEAMRSQPSHGYQTVIDYIDWWSDGEDSRYETN